MPRAIIRRSVVDDLDALVELGAEYCAADGHEFDEDIVRAGFAGVVDEDTHGIVLVADEGGVAVGYAVVSWGWSIEVGGRDVVLDEIYVRGRGRGIGGRLLDAVEVACRRAGARRIFLETEHANDRARMWYDRAGFVVDDSIWMSKELT